jgi:beta-mannanase
MIWLWCCGGHPIIKQDGESQMRITKNVLLCALTISAACGLIGGGAWALNLPLGNPSDGASDQGQPAAKRPALTENSIKFGVYDPHGDFSEESRVSIEHIFMTWEDVDLSSLPAVDAYVRARGRTLMITVEPWSWASDWQLSPVELLLGIQAGAYDINIASVCSAISRLQSPINIRWAHEMEAVDGPFPWARWSPKDYIAAYRHFVTECRKQIPDAKYVWSPRGDQSLVEFYPGDDYVDVIGLSVFGYQAYDKKNFGGERTFEEVLEPGYRLVSGFGKPVVVAELGYEGDESYVARWAKAAAAPHPQFPKLTAIIYFNDREVFAWPQNFGLPNWRIGQPR